ncbi:Reverse transcriptase domain [Arabidopsis thaliana x Arabidopsis arenosa]|uniref:Reverse transcriptase domain n=1 Tax=Arabidopsis thaliana x Arabidopsis arenosa TaxID=1240361 RepID=A0A8T1Z646_9BRAS|nr:Reverse transcriptase domain [Arabidopsis thaliana x Arabidopsis arenosa]
MYNSCKTLGLTHLSFADDLMVFSDGRVRSVEGITTVFDEFAKCSGLKISMEKSTLYLAGKSDAMGQFAASFPFDIGHLPVRYLGLPLLVLGVVLIWGLASRVHWQLPGQTGDGGDTELPTLTPLKRWVMDIPVFTMVGEWRCKEEEWKFEPWEGWFGRCVRVKENMTYMEFVRTLCEVFSLKSTECNPIISYWMPGKMSVMIESKRAPFYIDNQMSLDTFFLIRGGDPSVNLFVSFITTVKALGNKVPRTDGDDAESDRVCGSAKTPNPIVAASNVDANNEAVDEQDDVQEDKTDEDEEEEDTEDGDGVNYGCTKHSSNRNLKEVVLRRIKFEPGKDTTLNIYTPRIQPSHSAQPCDLSQLPMELQELYIFASLLQQLSMEKQQQNQSFGKNNNLSLVPMEMYQQDNIAPLMTMNQTKEPPHMTQEQQQPCAQATTHNLVHQIMVMETWLRTRTSFVDKRLILHSRLNPWGSSRRLKPLFHTPYLAQPYDQNHHNVESFKENEYDYDHIISTIDFEGLAEVTDPSQLPMELQEEYILGHQHQHFSMEQQQNQITGQATHLSSQLPVMMNQAVDEPHYCQPYHQNNDLSVVPMETQQHDNMVGNLASQLQLEEQDNVPVMTMNQTTEQQQPSEQATTHNELIRDGSRDCYFYKTQQKKMLSLWLH